MLYIKRIYFTDQFEKQNLEKCLRSRSLRRNKSLDILFETSNIGSDKYFFGNENDKNLKFTRIKTSFETILPKIIISFPKDNSITYYKLRPSFFTVLIFLFLSILVVSSFLAVVVKSGSIDDFFISLLLLVAYILLILLELKLTGKKIEKSKH